MASLVSLVWIKLWYFRFMDLNNCLGNWVWSFWNNKLGFLKNAVLNFLGFLIKLWCFRLMDLNNCLGDWVWPFWNNQLGILKKIVLKWFRVIKKIVLKWFHCRSQVLGRFVHPAQDWSSRLCLEWIWLSYFFSIFNDIFYFCYTWLRDDV